MNELTNKNFAVLGLGRFGVSVVKTLSEYDVDVLACDKDPARLHEATPYATHVIQVDLNDEIALQQLGLGNFDVVILAMGEDFEASILTTMMAKEQGAPTVVAKARGLRQKKILEGVGAEVVILPEYEMGAKVARGLVQSNLGRIFEKKEYFSAISEMYPKPEWVGKTIREADIRRRHNMTVLAVNSGGKIHIPVPLDYVMQADDVLVVLHEVPQDEA